VRLYKQTGSKNWSYEVQIDGRQLRRSTKTSNKADARRIAVQEIDALRGLARQARAIGNEPMPFILVAEVWWERQGQHLAEARDLGPLSPTPKYASRPINWLIARIGSTMVAEIERPDIVALIDERRRTGRVKAGRDAKGRQLYRPLAATTVNRTVPRLMQRILNYARENLRQQTQFIAWKEIKLVEPKRPIRVLSFVEEARIERTERPEVLTVRRFLLASGFRIGAVLNLTWPQVNFLEGMVNVIEKGTKPVVRTMTAEMRRILWEIWTKPHHPTHVFSYVAKKTRIEPRSGRKLIKGERYPVTYAGIRSASNRDWAKAGVRIRRHDMRHTAGKRFQREHGDIKATSRMLGHSSVAITERFYLDDDDPRLVEQLEQAEVANARKLDEARSIIEAETAGDPSSASPHTGPHSEASGSRKALKYGR
jgi:integrase